MTPPLALGPRAGADALDMCAAPGGKTSQMAALEPEAHITACELSAPRAEKLTYNLQKLGAHNVQVMKTDARRLDEFFSFDQILLDAPCTGTGTVRAGDQRADEMRGPRGRYQGRRGTGRRARGTRRGAREHRCRRRFL